jgi:hypothetical protein
MYSLLHLPHIEEFLFPPFFMLGFILKEIMRANGITSTHASLIIRDHINQTKNIYKTERLFCSLTYLGRND